MSMVITTLSFKDVKFHLRAKEIFDLKVHSIDNILLLNINDKAQGKTSTKNQIIFNEHKSDK